MAYYVLIIRRRPTANDTQPHLTQWGVEFGDRDRGCVEFELADFRNANGREFYSKIIRCANAKQSTIDGEVARANALLSSGQTS